MTKLTQEFIYTRGRPVPVAGVHVGNKCVVVEGQFVTVARLKDEWYDDVGDPEIIINGLKTCSPRPDIFTFWQRLPDTEPIHPYYYENEALSALPLKDFRHWWEKQIRTDTRKKAKRAEKRGIEIKVVSLDDDFVRGVMGVFNETPVRRGRRFWHYGKDFETLNPDGSWFYAVDQVRDFVDHFHTCFVLKALAKIYRLTRDGRIDEALAKGVEYYLCNLFDEEGLPKPFSKAPRLTVYKRELYDCAECINLCLLLRSRFPDLDKTLTNVVVRVLDEWVKSDGSFRSRQLHFGWDNMPMHRWGQSQIFRSLAYYLQYSREEMRRASNRADVWADSCTDHPRPSALNV